MSDARRPLHYKLLRLGLVLSVAALVLIWPTALLLDAVASKTVVFIGEKLGDEEIELNKLDFDPEFAVDAKAPPARQVEQLRTEVAAIYGLNPSEPTKVLFAGDDLIQPEEDASLLLMVRKPGDHVLQVQTVYWLAKMVTFGATGAALLCFGLLTFLRRRGRTEEVAVQTHGA